MAILFWLQDSNMLNVDFNTSGHRKQQKYRSVELNEMTMQIKLIWFDAFNQLRTNSSSFVGQPIKF